jgi:hypothetical protein
MSQAYIYYETAKSKNKKAFESETKSTVVKRLTKKIHKLNAETSRVQDIMSIVVDLYLFSRAKN